MVQFSRLWAKVYVAEAASHLKHILQALMHRMRAHNITRAQAQHLQVVTRTVKTLLRLSMRWFSFQSLAWKTAGDMHSFNALLLAALDIKPEKSDNLLKCWLTFNSLFTVFNMLWQKKQMLNKLVWVVVKLRLRGI